MWPRYFITSMIILFLALAGMAAYLVFPLSMLWNLSAVLLYGSEIMAINYLYRFGRFAYTRWRNALFLLIAAGIMGALCKIQHWPYADVLMTVSMLGIPVLYLLWFIRKRNKVNNDLLKLLWVLVHFAVMWLQQHHIVNMHSYGMIASAVLLFITYIQFWVIVRKKIAERTGDWDFDKGINA